MPRIDDENMNEKVRRLLKDLSKVNAPESFETELSRRINNIEHKKEKRSWISLIFSPKLVPSAALAATAVIILLLLKPQIDQTEEKFNISPQLKEEKIDERIELQLDPKKEKINLDYRQRSKDKSTDVTSESQVTEDKLQEEILAPIEAPVQNQPAVMNKMEVKPQPVSPNVKIDNTGKVEVPKFQKTEDESSPIEMLKEKIDTTKDSSKNSRKINKF